MGKMNYSEYKRNLDILCGEIRGFADHLCQSFGAYNEIWLDSLDAMHGRAEFRITVRDEAEPPQDTEFKQLVCVGVCKVVGDGAIVTVDDSETEYAIVTIDDSGIMLNVKELAT